MSETADVRVKIYNICSKVRLVSKVGMPIVYHQNEIIHKYIL